MHQASLLSCPDTQELTPPCYGLIGKSILGVLQGRMPGKLVRLLHTLTIILLFSFPPLLASESQSGTPSIADKTAGLTHQSGLLPLDWDARAGKLYLEVPLTDSGHMKSQEFLWVQSLPYGIGQNDLGLDRGQLGESRIVRFERVGPKVLLVEHNLQFRTAMQDDAARAAVEQSFPSTVLAGFKVEAESSEGAVLLDVTDLAMRDVHDVSGSLLRADQGTYKVDTARSAIALENTKAFPKNTDIEATLTFVSEGGTPRLLQDVAPDPHAVTVREHQSFLQLPEAGFTPRRYSPRAGYFPMEYREMNAPLGTSTAQDFIFRHRLWKKDPACTKACVAVAPIRYYVDRGAPEPIRTALVEGARWWDSAFQAAGWAPGTFLVDVLPEGADPLDVRYNMIQWVHRFNRGWSYGSTIADPRTGEILKGNVTLGSLRGRQDYLIAEALLAPYKGGIEPAPADNRALHMVLQRIRQLSAHETGHTLGLAHNFAASAFPHTDPDQTISVMDYPHPLITLDPGGEPDLSHAYPVGIGVWDKVAINYGYREFDRQGHPVEDTLALNRSLSQAESTGLVFITDEDARPFGSAHPHAHLWDNGPDAAAELDRILSVRSAALSRFGQDAIRNGTAVAQLVDTLVPLYLLHRYQTEAAIKEIGGLDYRYQVRGDGQISPVTVPAAEQQHALSSVLLTLSAETLTLPEALLRQFPPRPPELPRTTESFPAHTGLTFDPIAAAEAAADLTLAVLLDPSRASRLVEYHARDPQLPSLDSVEEALSKAAAARPGSQSSLSSELSRAVETRTVEALLSLAANSLASSQARAVTRSHLHRWYLAQANPEDANEAAHATALRERIASWERSPEQFIPAKRIDAPPGMPIGEMEGIF